MSKSLRVAIVGATGYTGLELVRFLLAHPHVEITRLVGHGKAGEPIAKVLPPLAGVFSGNVAAFDVDDLRANADVVFCALPHGASAPIVEKLYGAGLTIFDLSADFRLGDRATYEQWYGEHGAPALFGAAVYGLPELHREALRTARLVAVPGCYPTCSTLVLAPLLAGDLVERRGIVIDAKSGVSGAGRGPSASSHFPEIGEGFRAYKSAGSHRHTSEIEQELSLVAGESVRVTFTPHLVPMSRGMLATTYAIAKPGVDAQTATEQARAAYAGSPFVAVLDPGAHPDTLWVRGTNRAQISYGFDSRTGTLIGQSVIDNLGKGASGQAVQCMNVRFGFEENAGLGAIGVFP